MKAACGGDAHHKKERWNIDLNTDNTLVNQANQANQPEPSPHKALDAGADELGQSLNEMLAKVRIAGSVMESVSSELHQGTDELKEVSRKTEEATTKILDDSEKVVENHALMSERIASIKAALFDESLKAEENIKADFKALNALLDENKATMLNLVGTLSFQDPAGQQMRKVSSMLKVFQSRLLKMVVTFGENGEGFVPDPELKETLLSELEYSSGGTALDQDLVDRVLKECGFPERQ